MDQETPAWIRWMVAVPLFALLVALSCVTFNEVMHRAAGQAPHTLPLACKAAQTTISMQAPTSEAAADTRDEGNAEASRKSGGGGADGKAHAQTDTCAAQQVKALSTMAALCGALGAMLHALGSLVAFAGNGKFNPSWVLWYLAQPIRGALLAAGTSWLIQIGQLGDKDVPVDTISVMGFTFLIGLFSDPAIEKLRELFGVMFLTTSATRKGTLSTDLRKPAIKGVNFTRGTAQLSMQITGSGFDALDEVRINGVVQAAPTKRSDTLIELDLPIGLSAPGTALKVSITPVQGHAAPSNIHVTKAP